MGVARVFINNYRELPVVDEEIKRHFGYFRQLWVLFLTEKIYLYHSYPAMMIPPISENLLRLLRHINRI